MKYDEQHLVLLSIVVQLLDGGADIGALNPNVQEYLEGLVDEFNSAEDSEQEYFDRVFYYADTYFNQINDNNKKLN